jgi:hypothetical protein
MNERCGRGVEEGAGATGLVAQRHDRVDHRIRERRIARVGRDLRVLAALVDRDEPWVLRHQMRAPRVVPRARERRQIHRARGLARREQRA